MLEALLISNVMLWIAVLVLVAIVLALVRQVGVLHERVAPAGALMGADGPAVGEAAPRIELTDWSGRPCVIGGPADDGRNTLVAFVSPTCPVCKTIMGILDSVSRREGDRLRIVFASDGARVEHEEFVRTAGLAARTYVLSSELGLAYRVGKLPYAVLLDADGILRARGLVNTREHVESLFEAMEQGVTSVQDYLRRQAKVA